MSAFEGFDETDATLAVHAAPEPPRDPRPSATAERRRDDLIDLLRPVLL